MGHEPSQLGVSLPQAPVVQGTQSELRGGELDNNMYSQSSSTIVCANLSVAPRIENIPLPITSSLPLDISVPQTLKDKIMSNQFVELSQLLNPTQWDQYNLIMSGGSEAPTLSLQTRRRNKITNVDTWHNAYGIFCYIYLRKYPNDARSLLKYGSLVRGIARSGGRFRWI